MALQLWLSIINFTNFPQVQIIKQGYLLKRSSSLRADWKRRFFVLDSHGTLYYYRDKWNKQQVWQLIRIYVVTSFTHTKCFDKLLHCLFNLYSYHLHKMKKIGCNRPTLSLLKFFNSYKHGSY